MKRFVVFLLSVLVALPLSSQGFGFGFDDEGTGNMIGDSYLAVSVGGKVSFNAVGFYDDFSNGADQTQFGDLFSGKLNFTALSPIAKGVINFNLKPAMLPVAIDEAYLLAYLGKLDLTAGLRKLSWGKADMLGALDVINPVNYSNLSNLGDIANLKIARPLVHASLFLGQFSKLEGVFVLNFEPDYFAESGRWCPPQFASISQLPPGNVIRPDTSTIDYAQAGVRFTTTIKSVADLGIQYYYGRLSTPAVTRTLSATTPLPVVTFAYNPYHQIGLDYAQVLSGFNIRAEAAANITEDVGGDDSAVYNPSLAWSLGFDRDLFWGIKLTAQCNEQIKLFTGKISNPVDIEYGSDATSTLLIVRASKTFLRDELEVVASVIWDIESGASLIMPSIAWTKDDLAFELSTGIFAGSSKGLFGQFHNNSFTKLGIKYTF
jgi:hypothetical protein